MLHLYNVRFSHFAGNSVSNAINTSMNVVTTDLMRAGARVKEFYPDAKVWQINHRGRVDDIDLEDPNSGGDARVYRDGAGQVIPNTVQ